MTGRPAAALVACLVLAATGACSSSSKGSSAEPAASVTPSPSPSPTPSPSSSSAVQKGEQYVALGSSIASGYGISKQSTACGRSSRDYAELIAAKYQLRLVDVSCGAAVIPDVVDTKQGDNPPQMDAVTADTKLITISVGGNDIDFNGSALACGDPTTVCKAPADLAAKLAALPGQLQSMVEKVRAKAPSARIVFVTYPREMPQANCPAMSLSDSELAILRSMGEQLEATFAKVFAKSDVVFVDPYVATGDHTACGPVSARWTNGYNVPKGKGFAYHPTALGHAAMANLIEKALAG